MKKYIALLFIFSHSVTTAIFGNNAKVEIGQKPSSIGVLDEISFELIVTNLTEDSTLIRSIIHNNKVEFMHPNTGEWVEMETALDVLCHPSRGGVELLVDTVSSFITINSIASRLKKEQIRLFDFKDYEFKITYDAGTSIDGWLSSKRELFFTISVEEESGENLKAFNYLMSLDNPVFLGYANNSSLILTPSADYYYNHSKEIIKMFPNSKYVRNAELYALIYDYYDTDTEKRWAFSEKFNAISDKYKTNMALQDVVVGYIGIIKYKYQKK